MRTVYYAVRSNPNTEDWSSPTEDYAEAVEWATFCGPDAQIGVFTHLTEDPEEAKELGKDNEVCTGVVSVSAIRVIGAVMYGVFEQRNGDLTVKWYPRRRKEEALAEAKRKGKQFEPEETSSVLEGNWVVMGKRRGPFVLEDGNWQFAGDDRNLDCLDEVVWTSLTF